MDYLVPFSVILILSIITIISTHFAYTYWLKKRKFIRSIEQRHESLKFEKAHDKEELIKRALVLINDK